jgi:hypothetical protein
LPSKGGAWEEGAGGGERTTPTLGLFT